MFCANRYDRNSLTLHGQPDSGQGMLVVIDPSVADYQFLAAGVLPGAETIVLEPHRDAIAQITMALARRCLWGSANSSPQRHLNQEHRAFSLHIICHGEPGKLYLGKTCLSADNLAPYRQQLLEWGVGEILLYSCEVAAGKVGTAFVEQLSRLTGADIAASERRVGNAALGGSWDLESYSGEVSSGLAFVSDVVREYSGVFAIQFTTRNTYLVYEDGTYSGDPVTVIRTGTTPNATVDVVFGTAFDTATGGPILIPGVDYVNTTHTVTFAAGQTSVVVPLQINQDGITEGTEAFGLTLRNAAGPEEIHPFDFSNVNILEGSGGTTIPGLPGLPTIPGIPTIPDLSSFNLVGFTVANYQVNEDGTVVGVPVTIERAGLTNLASSIDVQLIDGTATGGVDFDNSTISVNFAAGETDKTVTIPIIPDGVSEGTENLTMQLVNGSSGTVLGLQETATLEILDSVQNNSSSQEDNAMAIAITALTQPNGFQIDEIPAGSLSGLGWIVKGNGKINDDDFDDFVILAPDANQLYVIYGGTDPTTLSTFTPDVIDLNSLDPFSVSVSLGNIDGDDFDDIIIGDHVANGAEGKTYVIWGNSPGTLATDVNSLDPDKGFTIINSDGDDFLGFSVSSGNINGGDVDDVIISDPLNDTAYVIFGNGTKYTGTFDISSPPLPSSVSTISGDPNSSFGFSVSSGDIVGDDKDDVIVGAPDANSFDGEAYVVSGNDISSGTTISAGSGFTLTNTTIIEAQLGWKVSTAGDVNGDGKEDLLVSEPGGSPTQRTYVVYGQSTFSASVNTTDITGGTGDPGFYIDGLNADDFEDGISDETISPAGDINNDGIDDFLIAEPYTDDGSTDSGAVYFVYGRSGGFGSNTLDLSTLTPLQGGKVDIPDLSEYDLTGFSVSDAGDVNGDLVDDFLIGVPNEGDSGLDGRVYVVLGEDTAKPIPETTVNIGGSYPLIGENRTLNISFDNIASSPGNVGYDPFVDLYLDTTGADGTGSNDDDGLSLVNIKYLLDQGEEGVNYVDLSFLGITPIASTIFLEAGQLKVEHPYAGKIDVPTGNGLSEGDTLYTIQLPHGSFVPDQPPVDLAVTVNISNYADYNVPLNIQTRGGFRLGADPIEDDNPIDPIFDTTYTSDNLTPWLYRIRKQYTGGRENETVTGPNFAKGYNITVDVAPGQTIQELSIVDTLPDNLQYIGGSANANPSLVSISEPPATPGGTLKAELSNVYGGSGVDANLGFEFYIPRLDAGGDDVIPRETGTAVTSTDVADADIPLLDNPLAWQPLDPRDRLFPGPLWEPNATHTLNDRSLAIQKGWGRVDDNKALGLSPGDVIEYTLDFQISDYFGFGDVIIEDTFSDGQVIDETFVPTLTFNEQGNSLSNVAFGGSNYPFTNPGSGNSGTIQFNISDELAPRPGFDSQLLGAGVNPDGGYFPTPIVGGTTGKIKFRTIIQEDFANDVPSGDISVDNGDSFSNSATLKGTVLKVDDPGTSPAPYPTPTIQTDNSSTGFPLPRGRDFDLSVYKIKRNGSVVGTIGNYPARALVAPGDEVTYRLEYTLPFADIEDLSFRSYLPLPSFEANTLTPVLLPAVAGNPTAVGDIRYHTNDTFHLVTGNPPTNPTPVITLDPVSNSLKFDYGDFDEPETATSGAKIDLLYTLEVGNDFTEDNLLLTNVSYEREGSTNAGSRTVGQIAQLKLKQIPLNITKGAVITSEVTSTPTQEFSAPVDAPIAFTSPGTPNTRFLGGTIDSNYLTEHGLDSHLSGVGLKDVITFAIVVENIGTSGFDDLVIKDTLPTGLAIPGSGLNLNVTNGAGVPIAYTGGDLFSGIELDAIGAFDPSSGSNVAVITFDLEVTGGEQFDNTAILESYMDGGTLKEVNSKDKANIISFASLPTINSNPLVSSLRNQFNNFVGGTLIGGTLDGGNPPQAGQIFAANPRTFIDADIPYGDELDYKIIVQKEERGRGRGGRVTVTTVYDSKKGTNLGKNPFESIDTSSLLFTFKNRLLGSPFSGNYTVKVQVSDLDPDNNPSGQDFDVQDYFEFQIATGTVINNYIADATVFFDANKNGILDTGEVQTTTDEQGNFAWEDDLFSLYDTNENGILDASEGQIVAIGGINTATGLELDIPLISVASGLMVTPLTGIVAALVDRGHTVEEANDLLTSALSIPNDVDVNSFDPIAATKDDVANGAETFAQHTMAMMAISQIKALLSGASSGTTAEIVDNVVRAIASEIETNTPLNLTDATQIETIINDSATGLGVDVSGVAAGAAQVIAAANQKIEDAVTNLSTAELEEAFAQVEKVALGETSQDLEAAGANAKPIAEVVAENTGTSLDDQIANVQILSDDPTDISLSNDSVSENLPIGTEVGTFSTIDPNPGETHSYSLVPGEGDTDNDSFEIVDNRLQTTEIFDKETKDTYNIRVRTSDGNGGLYWEEFTINVEEKTPSGNPIEGTPRRDVLTGTDGDDIITGLRGRDILTGGAGSDQFVYTSLLDASDIITDFEVGSDKIVLGQVLDSLNYSGTDPIADGYISFGTRGEDTIIRIDADGIAGPGRARSFILVEGVSVDDLNNSNNFVW